MGRSARGLWFVGATIVFALLTIACVRGPQAQSVFKTFYCAGKVLGSHADPYRTEPLRSCEWAVNAKAELPRAYVEPAPLPPYTLAGFAVLARLPLQAARLVFTVLALAATLGAAIVLSKLANLAPAGTLCALMPLALLNIAYGETPIFAAAAIAFAGYYAARGAAAAAAGAATIALLEPHVGIPAWLGLFVFVPRARVALLIGAIVLAGISVASAGIGTSTEYLFALLPAHAAAEIRAADQYSLTHLLHLANVPDPIALRAGEAWFASMIALGLLFGRRAARWMRAEELVVYVPSAFALFGGVFVHDYQMMAALPAALVMGARAGSAARVPACGALLLLIPIWTELSSKAVVAATVIGVFGAFAAIFAREDRRLPALLRPAAAVACVLALELVLHARQKPVVYETASFAALPGSLSSTAWQSFLDATPAREHEDARTIALQFPTWAGLVLLIAAAGSVSLRRPRLDFPAHISDVQVPIHDDRPDDPVPA